jgi:hypothetical protein
VFVKSVQGNFGGDRLRRTVMMYLSQCFVWGCAEAKERGVRFAVSLLPPTPS